MVQASAVLPAKRKMMRKPRIKPKPPRIKPKPRLRKTRLTRADIDRLGELLAAGHGDEQTAKLFFEADAAWHVNALHSIVSEAEKSRSWRRLKGCYNQAMMLFVFADMIYRQYPQRPFMTDAAFDSLARWLLQNRKHLPKKYMRWYHITSMGLRAGSAFDAKTDAQLERMLQVYKTGKVY